MKNLYLIGGTMGIGKTATCKLLKKQLNKSVFLDGDWSWDADPFQVTEETKAMVEDNICHTLNNFIRCSAYENIIFCWVMHTQEILNTLLDQLNTTGCNVKVISLICSEECLTSRLKKDIKNGIRSNDVLDRSIKRLPLYQDLDSIKIDTTNKQITDVVNAILSL